jgi:hypothetical protein
MPERDAQDSTRALARWAGLGYLLIIASGIFAEFVVRSRLIVPGDAAATARGIAAAESLFRLGIGAEFIMLICDVFLAAVLYVIFRPVSRNLALLAAAFRLVHAAIVASNLLNTYVPLLLVGDNTYLTAFGADQLHALALLLLNAHGYGYAVGLVFFGAHCLALGYGVFKSGYVPRLLGILLLVAGAGYLADSFGRTLLTNYVDYEQVFAAAVLAPALIAEVSFSLWLLLKGVNVRGARSAVREAA